MVLIYFKLDKEKGAQLLHLGQELERRGGFL